MSEFNRPQPEASDVPAADEQRRAIALLRAVADEVADVIFVKDRAGRYIFFNQAAIQLLGKPLEELLGQDDAAFSDSLDVLATRETDRRVMETGTAETREEEFTTGGVTRVFSTTKAPYRDGQGHIIGLIGIGRDITESKRAEEKFREREELFRLLAETSNDYISLHDPTGRTVYCSPSVERLYGRVPETLFEFVHTEDAEACWGWWERTRSGGAGLLYRRVHAGAGEWRWLETRGSLVSYRGALHVMAVCRDVTERKLAEDALRESERQLAEAVRIAHVGHWENDLDADRITWSAETCRIAGLPPEQGTLTLAEFRAHVHPDDRPAQAGALARALEGTGRYDVEYRFLRPGGEERYVHSVGEVIRDASGRPRRMFGVIQDVTASRRAEQALRVSERNFSALAEKSLQAIAIFQDERLVYANPTHCRLHGFTLEEFRAMSWADLLSHIHPADRPLIEERYRKRRAGQELNPTVEFRAIRRDGATRWVQTFTNYVEFNGKTALLSTSIDITDRKRAEEALRLSESRLAEAERIAHVGYWSHEIETGRVTASDETYRIFGLAPQEALRTWADWQEHLHPEDRWIRAAAIAEALKSGTRYEAEYRAIRPDGEVRVVHSQGEVAREGEGGPLRLFGIVWDITERKRAEEALRAAERRLQRVLASSPAVLYTLALDGQMRLAWMSDNIHSLLGYGVGEALAADWWKANIHPDDRDAVLKPFFRDVLRSDVTAAEFRFLHKNGRYRWIRSENRLLRNESGKPVEVVGSWSDVTQRKQLEDQFRQSQKMEAIGHLAGGVAHDFNNLLTIINGFSELLISQLARGDPKRDMLAQIRDAGVRAAGLTRQLLAFSRQTVLEPKILDLNQVVRENEKMLRRLIGEDVELTALLEPALQFVKVDPGQIGQVILNLAVNARDAMPTGGKLTIETRNVQLDEAFTAAHLEAKPGSYVLLSVADTGTGMPPAVLAHIFEPFFTTKGPGKGTGLGLATVYGIVSQSGGFISVDSEPNRGTVFKLYFPTTQEVDSGPKSSLMPKVTAGGSETILLVEDEDAVRLMIRTVLQQAGYTVLEANRGTEALRIAQQHPGPIHLLITDVVMPEMGGRQLVERLSPLRPGLRVLYLSGYTEDAVVRHGVLQADVAFLQKPFTMSALTNKVRQVLDAAAPSSGP